jgi:glutathione synthase/RimK-type ligase-like ATP-grasp enzyme
MLNKVKRLFVKILAFLYLLNRVNIIGLLLRKRETSDVIVWIKVNPLLNIIDYLKYNDLLKDLSIINALQAEKITFRVVYGSQIGKIVGKRIYYSISEMCNPFNLVNYSNSLYYTLKLIESQNNKLYPNIEDVLLWENKGFMHLQFEKLKINHPKTIIFRRTDNLDACDLPSFPLLVKELHSSGSRGLHLIKTRDELSRNISMLFSKGQEVVLIQKLVNMRRDLRLVLNGNNVVSYYWRINPDNYWKSTATSFGGLTEFEKFPQKWLHVFVDYMKLLRLDHAAFDIAWEDDDINSKPLILEVSPAYQLNPSLPIEYQGIPYRIWKKKIFWKKSYYKEYINVELRDTCLRIKKSLLNTLK